MIVSEIGIRNFKSFGNNEQVLKLNTESGELILLMGNNGNGKSSLIESIDYTLFNKVKGKKKRWQTLSTLPNRINKELVTRIKFNTGLDNIEVIRGQKPNILKLIENGIENDRAGKVNINEKIQSYIGMDVETFKSFISMSINDFKNFISLSSDEKKLLLDKLFNLQTINVLNSILKTSIKNNKKDVTKFTSEMETLSESIESIKNSINKVKEKNSKNIIEEINSIKIYIKSQKDNFINLKNKISKINSKKIELEELVESNKDEMNLLKNEITNLNDKIDLYNSGKCGYCESDLSDKLHTDIKNTLIEKLEKSNMLKSEMINKMKFYKSKYKELIDIKEKATTEFSELSFKLKSRKEKLETLNESNIEKENDNNLSEFIKTVNDLLVKKNISETKVSNLKRKSLLYKELSDILSDNGVKRTIIRNIITPINKFILENLTYMNMPFSVELDETFNAKIEEFGQEIEQDSLSTGETKKINISIMIAYLKLIRTKKNMNVLFLDEVFSSIDVEGIYSILKLLKEFAIEYKINIFLIHHSILDKEYFDRIIRIEKNIFSNIVEL